MRNKGDKTGQMRRWREKHREHYNEYQKQSRGRFVEAKNRIEAYPIDRVLIGYRYPIDRVSGGYDAKCVKCVFAVTQ